MSMSLSVFFFLNSRRWLPVAPEQSGEHAEAAAVSMRRRQRWEDGGEVAEGGNEKKTGGDACAQRAALRGVATVKARAFRDVWNVAAVIPVEKNAIAAINHHQHYKYNAQKQQHHHRHHGNGSNTSNSFGDDDDDNNFLTICSQELLAGGTDSSSAPAKQMKSTG
uniref:VAN3-binding protein-like auxin canalisation domain-containing protein n=1 Tax=Oryza meridionalis TaxID=40149 RepID=A0A0E0EL98_9ORYZ